MQCFGKMILQSQNISLRGHAKGSWELRYGWIVRGLIIIFLDLKWLVQRRGGILIEGKEGEGFSY